MQSLTTSEARANLYRLIDQAAETHQPIAITGKRANAVCFLPKIGQRYKNPCICSAFLECAKLF